MNSGRCRICLPGFCSEFAKLGLSASCGVINTVKVFQLINIKNVGVCDLLEEDPIWVPRTLEACEILSSVLSVTVIHITTCITVRNPPAGTGCTTLPSHPPPPGLPSLETWSDQKSIACHFQCFPILYLISVPYLGCRPRGFQHTNL